MRTVALLLTITVGVVSLDAQNEIAHRDDFEAYGVRQSVAGWTESSLADPPARRRAANTPGSELAYVTDVDPLDPSNGVFGAASAAGVGGDPRRSGVVATFTAAEFHQNLTFTGRFYRGADATRIGISFFSSLPEDGRHYLIALDGATPAMRLYADDAVFESDYAPEPGLWHRFRVETSSTPEATLIRVRFWRDGTEEPATDHVAAWDSAPGRLQGGRIGLWSAGGGAAWFDEIDARSAPANAGRGPLLAITAPRPGALLATARPTVAGLVDGAAHVTVNGAEATIDRAARTFTAGPIDLAEGPATIRAIATGSDGTAAEATLQVVVDTRAPDLIVTAPASNACLAANSLELRGRAFDPALERVTVITSAGEIAATLSGTEWSASLAGAAEGSHLFRIAATDRLGHEAVASLPLTIDRTAPRIEISASGVPLDTLTANRAVTPLVTASDLSSVLLETMVNGAPYTAGTPLAAEGVYELAAVATDCAGNRSEKSARVTIDATPPQIVSIAPEHGATLGERPVITGIASPDTARIVVEPSAIAFDVANGGFALDRIPLEEGENRFELLLIDRAGNELRVPYTITLHLTAPSVELLENGSPIAAGAVYTRPLAPVVRSSDPEAAITATLNGQPFAPGTEISADGTYTLSAFATDAFGHRSETVTVSFSIDAAAPAITITSPADGATTTAETIEVRGTVSPDATTVRVNGVAATVAPGSFAVVLPLAIGPNTITATAEDASGQSASAYAEVIRASAPAIVITTPPDGMVTNRRTAVIAGQVFADSVTAVQIGGTAVPVDAAGIFRVLDFALAEGENVITVAAESDTGGANQASVRVVADRTPPHLRILESGQTLSNNARFATQAVITTAVSEGDVQLLIDGVATPEPATITAAGGHTVLAIARDAAGNETRIERSITVGSAAGACILGSFDPPGGSIVTSAHVVLTGRSGGASSVTVNGVPATVANGSFCATVELPSEGENLVTIACEGASESIVLRRVTGDPSVEITSPSEGAVMTSETATVTGAVSGGASVEVNGVAATVTGTSFRADGVRLTNGMNVIVARARGEGGRTAAASRRVLHLGNAPSIAITSPPGAITTGAATLDVTGVWQNLDPATIANATASSWSDTSGTFATTVALAMGENVISISGRDAAGRVTTASVTVTRDGSPSISVTAPADNAFVSADSMTIEGSFTAAAGSTVEVNGIPAAITGNTFSVTDPSLASRNTPIPFVARVTQPDGRMAVDAMRVHRLAGTPAVLDSFPPAGATGVGRGVLPLILFSSPMDRPSLETALRLEMAGGAAVAGTLRLDRDVATFTPSALLEPGQRYTLRVTAAARDLAGNALGSELVTSFTIDPGTPSTAPALSAVPSRICADTIDISGTAGSGARLRIELGQLRFTTTAAPDGSFAYRLPLSGQSGHHVVRVRMIGSDGSESAAAESCFLVDCGGLQVVATSFDRATNRLTVTFSNELDSLPPGVFTLSTPDGRVVAASAALESSASVVVITPSEDLTRSTFTLSIGPALVAYTETFPYEPDAPPQAGDGSGFISGEVFDGATGWPLAGATVTVGSVQITTDARGRYAAQVPEGPHTIRITTPDHISAIRQIVVPAGAGVVPLDVRLSPSDPSGITPLTPQTLPGLLPLGWSAAAGLHLEGAVPPAAEFIVPVAEITAAAQTLAAVRYEPERDEWQVVAAVVNIAADGSVSLPIHGPGTYALVYGDRAPHLTRPPPAVTGAILQGVADPCAVTLCPPLIARSFTLDPPAILPTGKATATLSIEGGEPHVFPSGFAVQAHIDEQLRLADGSRIAAPPFTTDLILQRTLDGESATARFELAPSERAAAVVLEVGFTHVRIVPYPGRVDRGSIVGAEGGRVPGDGSVSVEIPAGAATEPLRATTSAVDTASLEPIAGFQIAGAFDLTLQRASEDATPVELFKPAAVSLASSDPSSATTQHILAEVLHETPYGTIVRMAAIMDPAGGGRFTSRAIDRGTLPIDGVVREGRYLLLAADAPIAFATGAVRLPGGAYVRDAKVTTMLGVADLTRFGGIFVLPVPASPAQPFSLVPRTVTTGDGVPYTHGTSPAADSIAAVGDVELLLQAPAVTATLPSAGAADVALTTFVKASFTPSIDPASIGADAIVVRDSTMQPVAGSVATEGTTGVVWTLPAGDRLKPNTVYTVTISAGVRAPNGAAMGRAHVFSFSTVSQLPNTEIRRDRIRITIPDANGHSRVRGEAGALPAGWNAVATRRGADFVTRPQGVAATDGAFAFTIAERVELSDLIDLQVINSAGAIAAIIPLTPFATDDQRGFVAPTRRPTRYVTPDGAAISVPTGAFAEPTVITTAPAQKSDLAAVPDFEQELRYATSIRIDFEGEAEGRLDVELPVPPGTDTSGDFLLGILGQSARGPRIMIVDTLRIENGKFTTAPEPAGNARIGTNSFLSPDVKRLLNGVDRGGIYSVIGFQETGPGFTWALLDYIAKEADIFWDALDSLYAAAYYVGERGRAVIPVPTGVQFQVVGVDATTGLDAFTKVYDPLPPGDPGTIHVVPTPSADVEGPYPVAGGPWGIQVVDVTVADTSITASRHFDLRQVKDTIAASDGAEPLPPNLNASLLNVTRGSFDASRTNGLTVYGEPYDRVILMSETADVDPSSPLSIVFSEALYTGGATDPAAVDFYLRDVITVEQLRTAPVGPPAWIQITPSVSFRMTDGARRLLIDVPALERGARYRVSLLPHLSDASGPNGGAGLRIGQAIVNGQKTNVLPEPVRLYFSVRAPGGHLHSFDIRGGTIRDQSLNGNILFVAAHDGGILAYDASDPTGMTTGMRPLGVVEGGEGAQYWSLATDHHGRVFATGLTYVTGFIRSFRLEDFIDLRHTAPRIVQSRGSGHVSWAPGASSTLGFGMAGDLNLERPEGIPRKIQVLLQDDEQIYTTLADFVRSTAATSTKIDDEFQRLSLTFNMGIHPYMTQRITIENTSLDLRWSDDATWFEPARFDDVIAREGDRMRIIINQHTYAVVAILGYGIAIWDLNAMESNDFEPKRPAYERMREQIKISRAALRAPDRYGTNPCGLPGLDTEAIRDLTYTPEAAILTNPNSSDLHIFALDPHRGVLDLKTTPPDVANAKPSDDYDCHIRSPYGLIFRGSYFQNGVERMHDHPRLDLFRQFFINRRGRQPFARYSQVSHYRWRLEAKDNHAVAPQTPPRLSQGARGSTAGTEVLRDYLLVASNEYGVLVVEAGGTPPSMFAAYRPLEKHHLVDMIWIEHGAAAVRAIPRTSLATVIDGKGHALLVDLSRLDERFEADGSLRDLAAPFPTAFEAMASRRNDPRVVWRSDAPVGFGTLAPVIDPDTGILYVGQLTQQTMNILAAIDPRIRMRVDIGDPNGMSDVGGIVPLGLPRPAHIDTRIAQAPGIRKFDASLGAFRLEVSLPGSLVEKLAVSGNRLHVAVENERVTGAPTAQTEPPYPRAHLRVRGRDGSPDSRAASDFYLRRVVPLTLAGRNRHQRGYNKFVSPWIVAIADPRASESYVWPKDTTPADKTTAGCEHCERPRHLHGKSEADGVWELYSTGSLLAVRPDFCSANCTTTLFSGTPYEYLGARDRLVARFVTFPADTIRPPSVQVAAQNPPAAAGALQETVYLHSGEVETSHVDIDGGGRAGWNVAFDRIYRSRTIGSSRLGAGWSSSLFRRLRELPNGDVEYRDAAGEVWRFRLDPSGAYTSPAGLFLRLTRSNRGWRLVDSKSRLTDFDANGRMTMESDEFAYDPSTSNRGNIIRYLYGSDGRLAQVLDPVARAWHFRWDAQDRLQEVEDWRGRTLTYAYDAAGRLTAVALPQVSSTRPTIRYGYEPLTADLRDALELSTNLQRIIDAGQSDPRVGFTYGIDAERDRLVGEEWGTGESAAFDYPDGAPVTSSDALGQTRSYTLSAPPAAFLDDRPHITRLVEHQVTMSDNPVGTVPTAAKPDQPPRAVGERTFTFEYEADGLLKRSRLEGVRTTTYTYADIANAPGRVLAITRTEPASGVPGAPIERTVEYQPGTSFVQAVAANGERVETPEPNRATSSQVTTNDSVRVESTYDDAGRVRKVVSTGGTDPAAPLVGSDVTYEYVPDHGSQLHSRGLLRSVRRPGIDPVTTEYPTAMRIVTTDERKVQTITDVDEWQRPRNIYTNGPGLIFDEAIVYDETGRVATRQRKQDALTVTTRYDYDLLGRVTAIAMDNAAVGAAMDETVETTAYDLKNRRITRTLPGGSRVVEELDTLGRVMTRITTSGAGSPLIREELVYDAAGNLVWRSDNHTMSASAFDVHGRAIESVAPTGTKTTSEYDAWGRPTKVDTFDAAGAVVGETEMSFTPSGRLELSRTRVDGGVVRESRAVWDGAGRQTGFEVEGRASKTFFDAAGRVTRAVSGAGSAQTIVDAIQSVDIQGYDGTLAAARAVTERNALPVLTQSVHDTAGNVTRQDVGTLTWQQTYDQSGNVTSAALPDRPSATYQYDSRGAMMLETKADGVATIHHGYDAAGSPVAYTDPVNEVTSTVNDELGRPRVRTYADGTSELFEYDGPRLLTTRDRQGRVYSYAHDLKGQLLEVRSGGGALLDKYEYDDAGRMTKWSTPHAVLTWENFDLEGRPKRTTQTRIDSSGAVIDSYLQEHEWNVHGERSGWTMPSYPNQPAGTGWTVRVFESHDAAGNVATIERAIGSSRGMLLDAEYRNAGRPQRRTVVTAGAQAAPIVREYGYNANGQMSSLRVTSRGQVVGGSDLGFDGLQVSEARLLGLSAGMRSNLWDYDARGRLAGASYGREIGSPVLTTEVIDPADVRQAHIRTQSAPGDPPSLSFADSAGHKMVEFVRGSEVRTFAWGGAERTDDGRLEYEYDARGRMVMATEKGGGRRIHYFYAGTNRVVGRRAEYLSSGSWKLEDRPDVLAADDLPAEVTYVWDAMTDRIAAIYRTGSSLDPSIDANGGLLRQIIHGGLGYDDPIEVAVADPETGAVHRLYPVFDEAAAGGLQIVMNSDGEVVARQLSQDPYGGEESTLEGAAVDRITVAATKSSTGALDEVVVSVRITEAIDPATIATGALIAGTSVAPLLADPHTLRWTFTQSEWSALPSLTITITNDLRAAAWSSTSPILPPPDWAMATKSVYTTATAPFEYRESIASIRAWLATINEGDTRTTTLYEVENLASMGTSPSATAAQLIVASAFQALPFMDRATGLIYARNRWIDPRSGSFLTPDPMSYRDSSNLYAFCAGDPTNCRDPEGLAGYFFDGTDNDREKMANPTNVAKLAKNYYEEVIYHEGVGSDWWTLPLGGFSGMGGQLRLEFMYRELMKRYNAGDTNIDIFGFSRGAALAVAFANLIKERGIPDTKTARVIVRFTPDGMPYKETVYDRYFRNVEVRFLGIFDTVGSFGLPGNSSNIGYDLRRPTNVKRIRHATAENEHRVLFPLTSMLDSSGRAPGDVIEREFRGAHSDVGGGYKDNDELARVPLGWMASEAIAGGVPIAPFAPEEVRATPGLVQHDSRSVIEKGLGLVGIRPKRKVYYQP